MKLIDQGYYGYAIVMTWSIQRINHTDSLQRKDEAT